MSEIMTLATIIGGSGIVLTGVVLVIRELVEGGYPIFGVLTVLLILGLVGLCMSIFAVVQILRRKKLLGGFESESTEEREMFDGDGQLGNW